MRRVDAAHGPRAERSANHVATDARSRRANSRARVERRTPTHPGVTPIRPRRPARNRHRRRGAPRWRRGDRRSGSLREIARWCRRWGRAKGEPARASADVGRARARRRAAPPGRQGYRLNTSVPRHSVERRGRSGAENVNPGGAASEFSPDRWKSQVALSPGRRISWDLPGPRPSKGGWDGSRTAAPRRLRRLTRKGAMLSRNRFGLGKFLLDALVVAAVCYPSAARDDGLLVGRVDSPSSGLRWAPRGRRERSPPAAEA